MVNVLGHQILAQLGNYIYMLVQNTLWRQELGSAAWTFVSEGSEETNNQAAPGCLMASSYGNLEILMPLYVASPTAFGIFHYWSPPVYQPGQTWIKTTPESISPDASGSPSLIQSSFRGTPQSPGNFEALVQEGNSIIHYWRDNSKPGTPWNRVQSPSFTEHATGPAALIQSHFRGNPTAPGNFEALVPEGNKLVHYWKDNSAPNPTWSFGANVMSTATGPASLIESTFKLDSTVGGGNFEALVLDGGTVRHFWRDNADGLNWHKGVGVPFEQEYAGAGPSSLIQLDQSDEPGMPADFEAVCTIGVDSGFNIVNYETRRYNSQPGLPWELVQQLNF